jgi:large subunit ribosomal protein L25
VARKQVGEPSGLAHPHACRAGIRQRDPAGRTPRGPGTRGAAAVISAALIGAPFGRLAGRTGSAAQRGKDEERHTRETDDVHPGDHQHDLRLARHGEIVARRALVRNVCRLPSFAAMAGSRSTALTVALRETSGSRAVRRLRREGFVPGIVYGGGDDPLSFQVESRELRNALHHAGAVLDLSVDGAQATPVVLKELSRHPVSGETMHIDLLRVRLDRQIQSTVVLELIGAEGAPGVREGGVLEHVMRELTIEALPNDIPDSIQHDVSEMQIGDTVTLEAVKAPAGVQLLDDLETVVATLTPPRLQTEEEEGIEQETELVGEGEGGPEGESGGDGESAGEGDSSGE